MGNSSSPPPVEQARLLEAIKALNPHQVSGTAAEFVYLRCPAEILPTLRRAIEDEQGNIATPPPPAPDEQRAEWRAFDKMMAALNGIEDGLSADEMRRRLYGEIHALRPSTPRPDERLRKALEWALPLAESALEAHRLERIRCGHNDIRATDAKGNVVIGLWQVEIDQRDAAREALASSSTPVVDGWYCPRCKAEVHPETVTSDERHELCGTAVTGVDETEGGWLVQRLRAAAERLDAIFDKSLSGQLLLQEAADAIESLSSLKRGGGE